MQCRIRKNSGEFETEAWSFKNWWLIDNRVEYKQLPAGDGHRASGARGWGRRLLAAVILGMIFLNCRALASQSVELTWVPSSDTNVTGYEIYYGGVSGVYTNWMYAGNVTSLIISGLTPGATYYFTAASLAGSNELSSFAAETSYTVPPPVTLSLSAVTTQGGVSSMVFTASGPVPASWKIEMSTDLVNWSPFYYGAGSPVNVTIPVASVPAQFFRLSQN
jgi:hypothetical protein